MYTFIALKTATAGDPELPGCCINCTFLEDEPKVLSTGDTAHTYYCWAHNHDVIPTSEDAEDNIDVYTERPEWCPLYKVSIDITGYLSEEDNETDEEDTTGGI